MTARPDVSIVIPCYNEAENLRRGVLDEVNDFLQTQNFSWEVIISNDGSSDESAELVQEFIADKDGYIFLDNKHGGKPYAVWQGIKQARGKITLFTDMDQSTPLREIHKLLPYFDKGYDVVIGSRGVKREGAPFYRQVAAWAFLNMRRLFLLPGIKDTQCGFKALKTPVAKEVFPKLAVLQDVEEASGWRVTAFDVELLYLVKKFGYKIKEVVVEWHDEDIAEGKNKNFIKESRTMLDQIISVKKNDWQGNYD